MSYREGRACTVWLVRWSFANMASWVNMIQQFITVVIQYYQLIITKTWIEWSESFNQLVFLIKQVHLNNIYSWAFQNIKKMSEDYLKAAVQIF